MLKRLTAGLLLVALCGCAGGAGVTPTTKSAVKPSGLILWPPITLYYKAQNIWVANYHECSDPATCETLNRVSASANGPTANNGVEIYPSAYPYPYGGIALSGSVLWYTSNRNAVVTCTITNGGSCNLGNVITGPATQLNYPEDVKLDPTGRPTIANTGGNSILTYDLGANGNVAPIRTIAGSNTQLDFPHAIAYDASGNLWVAQSTELLEFANGASGNVAPIRTIVGNQTGLIETGGIAIDRWGDIYVVDQSTNRLAMFKESGLGSNVSPDRIWSSNTALTHLNDPQCVAVDDYNIYVTNYGNGGSISVFSIATSAGNAATAYITGSATTYPVGLALQ
jgi:hypothetical protein